MFSIFLTRKEKENLSEWSYRVEDHSIVSKIFDPFWNWLVKLVPETVAPNILSLAGLLCILYAFHISYNYVSDYPNLVSISVLILTFVYMNLDSIDGKHARRTRNSSPLGELFDHSCDNIGTAFAALTLCYILGINNPFEQWYIVQASQLIFLNCHIDALVKGYVEFGKFSGPCEILVMYMMLIIIKLVYGFSWISNIIITIANTFNISFEQTCYIIFVLIYYISYLDTIAKILRMNKKSKNKKKHVATRNGLLISLFARHIPSILIYLGAISNSSMTVTTILSHGLIMSVLTGDIIVSKMAKRELHPLVPIMIMISLFDNFLCTAMCILYYTGLLTEIAFYMRLPLFGIKRTVFCNGVYDLLHAGHMNLFESAATYGSYLIVGVHNDKDVASYKRTPALTHEQRCSTVRKCKYVDEVIPDCPLYITKKFIEEHNIDVVLCSEEYNKEDDQYYKIPREMGILEVLPRTPGISTSDILKRVQYITNT